MLRRLQKSVGRGIYNDLGGSESSRDPTSKRLRPPGADTRRSARDLNNSILFFFPEKSKRKPLSLFRGKVMGPTAQRRPCYPPPRLNAPRTFEKTPRLRRGGIRGARSSEITHRRSAARSRGPAPTGPSWRTAAEALKSLLIAGAASALPPLGSDP